MNWNAMRCGRSGSRSRPISQGSLSPVAARRLSRSSMWRGSFSTCACASRPEHAQDLSASANYVAATDRRAGMIRGA